MSINYFTYILLSQLTIIITIILFNYANVGMFLDINGPRNKNGISLLCLILCIYNFIYPSY